MNARAYLELQKQQRKELEDFPIAYAFNEEQLKQALEKLNATKKECVTVWGCGDILKRTDVPAFKEMLKCHREEIHELLKDEQAAEEAFLYEMDNHEYAINYDGDADVLACFDLSFNKLDEIGLRDAYLRARNRHMKHSEEWA